MVNLGVSLLIFTKSNNCCYYFLKPRYMIPKKSGWGWLVDQAIQIRFGSKVVIFIVFIIIIKYADY